MSKREFLERLRKGLHTLPQNEMEESLNFYGEMIDDYMEEGMPEEEAVAAVGSAEDIVRQILADTPAGEKNKEENKPKKRIKTEEAVLLILGFPLWFPLCVAALAVVLSLYAALWSVVVSLWAVFASLAATAVGGVAACIVFALRGNLASAFTMLSVAMVCGGLSVFAFYVCKALTKGAAALTKSTAVWLKNRFTRKEAAR